MTFTTKAEKAVNSLKSLKGRSALYKPAALLCWVAIWEAAAAVIDNGLLLVGPWDTLKALSALTAEKDFWSSIWFSFSRIAAGFLLGTIAGVIFAALSYALRPVREFLAPAMTVIKSTPVASFIILALVWVKSKNLSSLISFLMVLPVIYSNVLAGLMNTDKKLLEMAKVFRVPKGKRALYIYVFNVLPYFLSGVSVALGFAWKSGIAAEVIAIPDGSIGEKLYFAKMFLATPDLMAWTATVIILSLIFEKLFVLLMKKLARAAEA